ncbi:MAG: hypothetical protein JNN04_03290 [Cyclobacteriaceae bacterium]|nr:hypothetical protein [Cyclobacteriaceae bacterium]
MKKLCTLLVLVSGLMASNGTWAQGDLDQLLRGSQADANYLAQGYLEPVLNAIGSGLNQGWYNTAANHKKFGFDLTITASSIQFPSEDLTYFVDNNKLQTIQIVGDPNAPTFVGSDVAPTYAYKAPLTGTFQGPPGINVKDIPLGGLPMPMVNVGIGLLWNTDLKIRWASVDASGGAKVNLFGLAVQHDIKQHIPGLKELPFDLSALVGYTSFSSEVGFDPAFPDQKGKADFSATTIQGLIGKKFSVLTLYGGVGYNFSSGNFKATGTYTDSTTGNTFTDPINISSSVSGPRFTGGLRLKLAVFTLHGDYTFQRYNTITVGFGIAVR